MDDTRKNLLLLFAVVSVAMVAISIATILIPDTIALERKALRSKALFEQAATTTKHDDIDRWWHVIPQTETLDSQQLIAQLRSILSHVGTRITSWDVVESSASVIRIRASFECSTQGFDRFIRALADRQLKAAITDMDLRLTEKGLIAITLIAGVWHE